MSVTFPIATAPDEKTCGRAIISARQLAAFRQFLIQEGARTGVALIDPEAGEDDDLAHEFEARVCPIALACFARLFDYDESVIGIIEQAQFQTRRVSIFRTGDNGEIAMSVAFARTSGSSSTSPTATAMRSLKASASTRWQSVRRATMNWSTADYGAPLDFRQ